MKKKITALILLCTTCLVTFAAVGFSGAYAEENDVEGEFFSDRFMYYLRDFVGKFPKREAFSTQENAAGEYLASIFNEFGYAASLTAVKNAGEYYDPDYAEGGESFNVVARKTGSERDKTVILGAHYDSSPNGNGAFDNGSGVAILLTVAEALMKKELPFDTEFVAFGAEEPGLIGSQAYADSITSPENVLIYINFDVCVGGDKLFVYCEDVYTPQLGFFAEVIKECGAEIEPRTDMKPIFVPASINPYYSHVGMRSDNRSFNSRGIPTANFFSGSLDNDFGVYTENPDGSGVMHTKSDTLSYFTNNENKVRIQAEFLVKTVVRSLTKNDFKYKMTNATVVSGSLTSYRYPLIAFAVLNLLAIVAVILINGKNKRDAAFGDGAAKEKKEMFSHPEADDVFEFRK